MKDSKTDTLIVIGAGITGLMTAINAKLSGLEVYLLEKGNKPSGSSVRIAGVLHSGARFAGSDNDLAKVCFEEWKWWISVLSKDKRKVGGYFIKLKNEPTEYLESWLNSLKSIGIPFSEIDSPELGKEINANNIDKYYFVPEIQINASFFTNELVKVAETLGINYLPLSSIQKAEINEDEYEVTINVGNQVKMIKGFPIITSGIDIPEVAKKFGVNLEYSIYQGSHILINTNINELLEFVHKPGTYDLLIPSESGAYITPTLVPYNRLIITEEELESIGSALKNIFINKPEVIGYMTAGRISINSPKSVLKGDYIANLNNLIIAWSNNYACSRRVSYYIAEILGIKKVLTPKAFNFS